MSGISDRMARAALVGAMASLMAGVPAQAGDSPPAAPPPAAQPTAAHIKAVRTAQTSAYIRTDATNGCPLTTAEVDGWAAGTLRYCEYQEGAASARLTGAVYLLETPPEAVAAWIETACAEELPGVAGCFATVLHCGRMNSGMMFAVGGNVMENMDPTTWKNYFFRNGMTVAFKGQANGGTKPIPLAWQQTLAVAPDSQVRSIPSGRTRFWRTQPDQFAAHYPDAGAPSSLATVAERTAWLGVTRTEMVAALGGSRDRLLNAWVWAHPKTLAKGVCPGDGDP